MDLFERIYPDDRLHEAFLRLRDGEASHSTRRLMSDAADRFSDKDGNFVEQFQTFGFNTRTFELYISELLHSEHFEIDDNHHHPDFVVSKGGAEISIECTTTNPTDRGEGQMNVYRHDNDADADLADVLQRRSGDLPIRLGGAIRNKMLKRFGDDGRAYWQLPQTEGRPFIIAIQSFHEPGALSFSNDAMANYLYGMEHRPSWDSDGNLVVVERAIDHHERDGREIQSGLFLRDDARPISAVLWTNAGTAAKFSRIARTGPYPDPNVSILRYGQQFDPNPNAIAAPPFAYIVGDEGAPAESWGQSAILFHNPNADFPVPVGLFDTVSEGYYEDGQFCAYLKSDFDPIWSSSRSFHGEGHRRVAVAMGDLLWPVLVNAYRQQCQTHDHPIWGDLR